MSDRGARLDRPGHPIDRRTVSAWRGAPWHLTGRPILSLGDRLRLIAGMPLFVRFTSPDRHCHAACTVSAFVQRDWPEADQALRVPPARTTVVSTS